MGDQKKKIHIPKSLTEGYMQTQEQLLEIPKKGEKLFIGIAKEEMLQENRVSLVPSTVGTLINQGHRIIIESGAGERAHFLDNDYSEMGAEVVYDKKLVYQADILLKVAPPSLDEIELMHPNQILISPLQLPLISDKYIRRLMQKRVIALAMEYIQDASGSYPVVRIMSEMAGTASIFAAAHIMATTNK